MPTHYGGKGMKGKKKNNGGKKKSTMKPMTKEEHAQYNKAVKDGLLTQKQHDNLPPQLLKAIIKKKKSGK